jgi:hypothetical protein
MRTPHAAIVTTAKKAFGSLVVLACRRSRDHDCGLVRLAPRDRLFTPRAALCLHFCAAGLTEICRQLYAVQSSHWKFQWLFPMLDKWVSQLNIRCPRYSAVGKASARSVCASRLLQAMHALHPNPPSASHTMFRSSNLPHRLQRFPFIVKPLVGLHLRVLSLNVAIIDPTQHSSHPPSA